MPVWGHHIGFWKTQGLACLHALPVFDYPSMLLCAHRAFHTWARLIEGGALSDVGPDVHRNAHAEAKLLLKVLDACACPLAPRLLDATAAVLNTRTCRYRAMWPLVPAPTIAAPCDLSLPRTLTRRRWLQVSVK